VSGRRLKPRQQKQSRPAPTALQPAQAGLVIVAANLFAWQNIGKYLIDKPKG
jgi:hypothetical protein